MSEKAEELIATIQSQMKKLEEVGVDDRTHIPFTFKQLKILIDYISELQNKFNMSPEQMQDIMNETKAFLMYDLAEDWETDHNGAWSFVSEWLNAKGDELEVNELKDKNKIVPEYLQKRVERYLIEKEKAREIMEKLKTKELE